MPVATITSQTVNFLESTKINSENIPEKCTVLVVGGGPGGSYAACALAREGLDVVLLEAEVFPRYHIGESMLASMRHLLRFVGMDEIFDKHGFTKKVGAAFKLNGHKREGYTDFLAAGGPNNYAWNVIRSEADELMLRHAQREGVKVFEGIKVTDIEFEKDFQGNPTKGEQSSSLGRPVSACWKRRKYNDFNYHKVKGTETQNVPYDTSEETGKISFTYIIDASGRAGLLSTRYLKNRTYNRGLRNVALWGYWTNTGVYARGTPRERSPFFEALTDESGWAWLIPLHDGTTSVGVVQNQGIATEKKGSITPIPSTKEFYLSQLKLAPNLMAILHNKEGNELDVAAQLTSDIKSASDYSYSSTTYAIPYARVVGDAGCFIDPYFSSGVHLALTSALSAAVTICAAIRHSPKSTFDNAPGVNDSLTDKNKKELLVTEERAARWHSEKVGVAYTRFLMVVLSAYKQIRAQEEPVLADFDEDNFDRAFSLFRPIIQGTADVAVHLGTNGETTGKPKLTQEELSKTLQFCSHAFEPTVPEEREAVVGKLMQQRKNRCITEDRPAAGHLVVRGGTENPGVGKMEELDAYLTEEETRILKHIKAREMMRTEDTMNISGFRTDVIDGLRARLVRGKLGLDLA